MSEIKSVAIAGGPGSLGTPVLKALVDAGFQVTVLTRSKHSGIFDDNVKVLEVDFASLESLTIALQGTDAVVSTVATAAHESQLLLIDAAVAAGVKRFIPSEFGSCNTNPKVQYMPFYSTMAKVRTHLQEQARISQITWTVLQCGGFLDWILASPILIDFANHKTTLLDEGDNRMTVTSLSNIAKGVAAILKNSDATKNKVMRCSEIIVTQNMLLGIAKEIKPEVKWNVNKVSTREILEDSLQKASQGDFSMPVVMGIIKGTACAGDEYGAAFDQNDNELLGVREITREDLKKLVEKSFV